MKRSLISIFAFALLLGACSAGDSEATTTTGLETTSTTESNTTTTADKESTTSDPTTTTVGAASGGDEACLVGDWVLDDEKFFESVFTSVSDDAAGFGDIVPGDGQLVVSFASGGTIDTVREEWGFTAQTDQGDFKIVINGEQGGTWDTEGTTLTIDLDESADIEIKTSFVVDGEEIELPQAPIDVPSEALSATSEYSCSGDTFTINADGIISEFTRSS